MKTKKTDKMRIYRLEVENRKLNRKLNRKVGKMEAALNMLLEDQRQREEERADRAWG